MAAYVLKRVVTSIGLLVLSSVLIFVVLRLIPGDPTISKLGGGMTDIDPRAYQALRHQLGLDRSLSLPVREVDRRSAARRFRARRTSVSSQSRR